MNALSFLKTDHKEINQLLQQADSTSNNTEKTREKLFKKIKERLKIHELIEEIHFYPQLKEYPETKELILEAYEEHALIDALVKKLEKEDLTSDEWIAKLTVLQENIEHHVNEEEEKLFPRVRKILSESILNEIGASMQKYKS